MSTIPKEIQEKIDAEAMIRYMPPIADGDKEQMQQECFIEGAFYCYQLATDGREQSKTDFDRTTFPAQGQKPFGYDEKKEAEELAYILRKRPINDGWEELKKENEILKDRISDTEYTIEHEKINKEWEQIELPENIAKLRDYFKENDKTTFEHWAYTYLTNLSNQITALQSQCTEKDKEIERQTNLKTEYKEMYQNAAKIIEELKAENEILKGLLDQQCINPETGKPYYKGDSEHYDGRMGHDPT